MSYLNWYNGRRIFVTGHTGFKGAWLSLWLIELGAEVTGFALEPEPGSMFSDLGIANGMTSLCGDIRDSTQLDAALTQAQPEAVIHMAALSLVRPSFDDPVATFETNVIGTAKVLDAMRDRPGLRAGLVVTSDKCYENTGDGAPLAEDAPMGGHDPYSASKGCAELVTQSYARSFFQNGPCSIASVRAGNVFGGGDWAKDRIIPDLARAACAGTSAFIRRPDAVRPWQHVLEPLSAYLLLTQALTTRGAAAAGAWNVGPQASDLVPVRDIAKELARHWAAVQFDLASKVTGPHEAPLLSLDSSKICDQLGWRSALSLPEALELTADWYREYAERFETIRDMTLNQIRFYSDRTRGQG